MKSSRAFKRQAQNLRAQLKNSEFDVECAEHDFYDNPCKETWDKLNKARKASSDLYDHLMAVNEVVDHYDFYEFCEQEEEMMAPCY